MQNIPKFYSKIHLNNAIDNIKDPVSPGTQAILAEAEQLGITWNELAGTKIIELHYKENTSHFRLRTPFSTKDLGIYSCMDKHVTKVLLKRSNVNVVKGHKIYRDSTEEDISNIYNTLTKPLVIKPTHASHGDGISMDVEDTETYHTAIKAAFVSREIPDMGVLVEETFTGQEYRVLVTRKKVLAAMYRIPANVVGDGQHTLQELIDIKNLDPKREYVEDALFRKLTITEESLELFKEQNVELHSVVEKDKQVFLRTVSNLSQGGDGIDVTDLLHQSVKDICLQAINAMPGLEFAGLDFMTKDITANQTPETYSIIEINHNPELAIHDFPIVGKKRNVCFEFLALHFPELYNDYPELVLQ